MQHMTVVQQLFREGGPMMWVLLAWSIVGLCFIIERFITLWFRYRINAREFVKRVMFFVSSHNYARAIEVCNAKPSNPLSKVLKAGLLRANKSEKEIQRSMEEEMLRSLPDVQKNIDYVAMAANTATLLGLLGTIFGLIMAFYYLRFGRVVPLILAHYVTNALQVVVFSALAR